MNGLMKSWRLKTLITTMVILALSPLTCWSAQTAPAQERSSQQEEEEKPDGELLEFLGLFDDTETGWVDPIFLLESDDDFTTQQNHREEEDEKQ